MSTTQRSQMVAQLWKIRVELGVVYSAALEARALSAGNGAQQAQNLVSEIIDELQGNIEGQLPIPLEFSTAKH
jgi:hypothetical protein